VALDEVGDDREKSSPQDGEADGEEKQIIEEEAGFAGDEGLEFVLALEVIAIGN